MRKSKSKRSGIFKAFYTTVKSEEWLDRFQDLEL